jgi:hypothetical protein
VSWPIVTCDVPLLPLLLLHHLEQRALDLGRGPVDLVGEQQVREDGSERGRELTGLLVVDPRADEVGRHEIRGELDPLELATDRLGQCLDRHRLGEPRHALDEEMAAGEEGDRHPLEEMILADDDLLHLVEQALHRSVRAAVRDGIHRRHLLQVHFSTAAGRRRRRRHRSARRGRSR